MGARPGQAGLWVQRFGLGRQNPGQDLLIIQPRMLRVGGSGENRHPQNLKGKASPVPTAWGAQDGSCLPDPREAELQGEGAARRQACRAGLGREGGSRT